MSKKINPFTISVLILLIVIAIAYFAFNKGGDSEIDKKTAECISSKSVLYISSGCIACASQEKLFGENFQYLNAIDCKINEQSCIEANIINVPTWLINGTKYEGVQLIEKLKELTGC